MSQDSEIIAFCHIIKCSGTTLSSILRRNYGIKQLSALPKPGLDTYSGDELRRDLKLFPHLKSITGHCLRPYLDYGEHNDRLIWFSWLRDPLSRLISGYQHSIEKGRRTINFEDWLQEPLHRNLQVYFLTGSEDDLQGAKDVILNKMKFVGLVERFDESLILFKSRLGLSGLNIDYPKMTNTAKKGEVAANIYSNLDQYKELIDHNISVDRELYDWFVDEVYPEYINSFGEKKLEDEIRDTFVRANIPSNEKIREFSNNIIRKVIYKPVLRRL